MPTVRCPSCNRALHLPEAVDIATAQCPLCRTTFDVASRVEPPRPPPRSAPPAPPSRERERPVASAAFDLDETPGDVQWSQSRAALRSAAFWLKTGAVLSMGRTLLCGCCPFQIMRDFPDELAATICFCYFVHMGLGIVLYFGADALARRTSYRWAMTACVLGLIAAGFELLFSLPALGLMLQLARGPQGEDRMLMCGIFLVYPASIAALLAGSLKGFAALRRREVREAFRR